jgi:hypothetical protein
MAAEEEEATRELMASQLYKKRTDFLTEELEERLRMHWPRKGRTEVGDTPSSHPWAEG